MYSDPLAIDDIIRTTKQKLPDRSPYLRDFKAWSNWIKKQRNLYFKGKIASHQYYERSTAFVTFIKSKMGISTDITENILSYNYCPSCLNKLSEDSINQQACSNCRRRISLDFDKKIEIPPRMDFLYSLTFFIGIFISPRKTFHYLRFGLSSWAHPIIIYLTSSLILSFFTFLVIPQITYPSEELILSWWEYRDQAFIDVSIGYAVLNLFMLLLFSIIFYLFSIGSQIKHSPAKIIQITSLILIPRMIFVPLTGLYNQLVSDQIYLMPYPIFNSTVEARWLLLDLSEYLGVLEIIVVPLSAFLSCMLLVYALKYTWDIDTDAAVLRAVIMGALLFVLIYGIHMYI